MRTLLVSLIVICTVAGIARADGDYWSPPPAPPTAVTPVRPPAAPAEWYGWQTLAADGAAAASWILAYRDHSNTFGVLGTLGYLAGAPLIHGLHDRPGAGLSSAAMRLGVPMLGGIAGLLIGGSFCAKPPPDDRSDVGFTLSSCAATGGAVGLFGSMIALSIFDASRSWVTPGAHEWHPHRDPTVALIPTLAPTNGGAALGLVGRF